MSADDTDQDAMAAAWGTEMDDDETDGADAGAGGMDDQDAMAAAWGAEMDDEADGEDGEEGGDQDAMAAAWGAEMEDDVPAGMVAGSTGTADRVLNQDEIDNLLGFDPSEGKEGESRGIRALINSTLVSYERLPMLEIIFDRLVRLMTTSLRNFTSDNIEVSLDSISSIRFGDYLNSIPLPAILAVFKAREWDNFGLFTIESNLIYSVVDVLLGGRRGTQMMRIEGRPYTTIELGLLERMVEVILKDAEAAFEPISKVAFDLDRLETNPRFAAITRSANAAILVRLRIDMEDRGGRIELMLPYATVEPIRELLLQGFMGERFGRDSIWEGHLATELWSTKVRLDAVLDEIEMPLRKVMDFKVGQTIMLDRHPDAPVRIRCGDVNLTEGKLGQIDEHVAVRLARSVSARPVASDLLVDSEKKAQEIAAP